MKFSADRQTFHKVVSIVDSIIPAREIRSIISNILIEAEGDRVVLTATDLEIGIKTFLNVDSVEQKGKITLPAKKLSQAIREFRGNKIEFHSNEDDRIVIRDPSGVSGARITLMGTPSDEYPIIPTLDESKYSEFPINHVQEMIRKTSYSMAEEDARYVFNGLYIINEDKKVSVVATDGRRLSRITREFPESLPFKDGIILPNKAVREMLKVLDSGEEGRIAFESKDRRVYFRLGNVDLITKLIDGQYPDYEQVIPGKLEQKIVVDRTALENSLRQVAVMAAEPSRQVRVTFGSNQLTISAATPDVGEAQDTVPTDYNGDDVTIAFNSNYLLDVLKVLNIERVSIGFSSSSAPVVLLDPDDNEFIAVIMPMKM
ncbi:MAG: DNA polymerase III subunit beta [Leptospiraceae bacterium]|nr:DNA polymerase III subunit beta [Leptospiraceae bacterium]MCB1317937.1 DNA polymerase III subunit beta [Leptospiraceae bacterium]MCB1321734.1 DNA polymerase III subunit beta [Leptospiraceae bacterium]